MMIDFDLRPLIIGLLIIGAIAGACVFGIVSCVARTYDVKITKQHDPGAEEWR